jgi:hypothetical protein
MNSSFSSSSSSATAAEDEQKPLPLEPFVRNLLLQMDNCVGTNKSQFFFGGLAILVLLGILDSIEFAFMFVGHTKFKPDVICRHIAGQYHINDVFNLGMLMACIAPVATCVAYNEEMLRTWKESSKVLFTDVPNITLYRYFMLIGADEPFANDLGNGVAKGAKEAPETADFPGSGRCYSEKALLVARTRLAERSLVKVIEQVRGGCYYGVGSGDPRYGGREALVELERAAVVTGVSEDGASVDVTFEGGGKEALVGVSVGLVQRLDPSVPLAVGSKVLVGVGLREGQELRKVRLFARVCESDSWWIEIAGYQKAAAGTVSGVETALLKCVRYSESEVTGQQPEQPYGAKKTSIEKNYKSFVPVERVPDKYAVERHGLSGAVNSKAQVLLVGSAEVLLAERRAEAVPLAVGDRVEVQVGGDWVRVRVDSVNRSEMPQNVNVGGVVLVWPDSKRLREAPTVAYDKDTHDRELIAALGGLSGGNKEAAADRLGIARLSVVAAAVARLLAVGELAAAGASASAGAAKVSELEAREKKKAGDREKDKRDKEQRAAQKEAAKEEKERKRENATGEKEEKLKLRQEKKRKKH